MFAEDKRQKTLKIICDYSQPDFYHFSQDSIDLVEVVLNQIQLLQRDNVINILDVGTGCGIVGIELSQKIRTQFKLVLLEKQNEFYHSITQNFKQLFNHEFGSGEIVISDVLDFNPEIHFNIITFNAPFYRPDRFRSTNNRLKKNCKMMDLKTKNKIIEKCSKLLSPGGMFFLLDRYFNDYDWSKWQIHEIKIRDSVIVIAKLKM